MAVKDTVPYGQRLLPQVLDEAAEKEPTRVFGMQLVTSDVTKGFKKWTVGELARAVNHTAYWIEEKIGKSRNFEVIAYIGINDFRYYVMELAAMKCGYPILLPSLRNSDAINKSLFGAAKCTKMFYSDPFQAKTVNLLVDSFRIPSMVDMVNGDAPVYPYNRTWDEAKFHPAAVCHTSGSTGNPKPVFYNHAFLGIFDSSRKFPTPAGRRDGNMSLLEGTTNFVSFPQFHMAGLSFGLGQLFYQTTVVFPSPETPATGNLIVDVMREIKLHALIAPPIILDEIVKKYQQEFAERSQSLQVVITGSGPVNRVTGEYLSQRLDLVHGFGSTEVGQWPTLVMEKEKWMFFEWNPLVGGISMDNATSGSEDLYEAIIKKKAGQEWAQPLFYIYPDLQEWRTRDLFRKHPTQENLWLYEGRVDDVIVLNNGEKFNPVIMEQTVSTHPLVTGVLAVGTSFDQVGLILESQEPEEDLIEKIWSTVEKANRESPTHARVYRHMITMTKPDRPFPRAGKGTIQRAASEREYKTEIAALFSKTTQSRASKGSAPRIKLPKSAIKEFVREAVAYQLQRDDFIDSDDLYFLGLNSLQTTELSQTLSDTLNPFLPTNSIDFISPRMIYDMPSVEKLTATCYALLNPNISANSAKPCNMNRAAFEQIQSLVKKYTGDLPKRTKAILGSQFAPDHTHVAVTGTTGFLGYYLLVILLEDPTVGKVTCLNRSPSAKQMFLEAYSASPQTKNPPANISKLDFLQVSSFGDKSFGLPADSFVELVNTVDIIVHNAWKVDFNLTLSSFENPHLIGIRTLIEWSLSSPRNTHICFISSISSVAFWPGYYPGSPASNGNESICAATELTTPRSSQAEKKHNVLVPESPPDFSRIPSGRFGYAQSKYAAEAILDSVATTHGVPVTILRSGQIANATDTPGPLAHQTEWFPRLLTTSKNLKMLPRTTMLQQQIDFLPADRLARIIFDIVIPTSENTKNRGTQGGSKVFNLVNPHPVAFTELLPAITHYFKAVHGIENVKVVSFREWVAALEKLDPAHKDDVKKYPSLELSAFFAIEDEDETANESVGIETARVQSASETMRGVAPVSDEDVLRWLKAWEI